MKNVFLTGASAGIGLATAQRLCSCGFRVWGTSRQVDKLPRLPNFHPLALDLNNAASIHAAFAQGAKESGGFDILVNNAGNGIYGPVEAFSTERLSQQWQTLVLGPLQLIRLILPSMRARNAGTILNVTSLAARFPIPFLGPYSAAKAALSSLTETLRLELAQTKIHVIDLQPGDIASDFNRAVVRVESPCHPAYQPVFEKVREQIDREMAAAPAPEIVARAIHRLLDSSAPAPLTSVGNFFQARLAPFCTRFYPRRWVQWGLKKYYRLS